MTRGLVIDCSVTATWLFDEEAGIETDKLLERVRDAGGVAPALWHWEVANVLAIGVRRKRFTCESAVERLARLNDLPIATDDETPSRLRTPTFLLAQAHNLTAYDAAYLELAQRTGLPLATKDDALRKAAKNIGIEVLP